jgi:hypothetical protein
MEHERRFLGSKCGLCAGNGNIVGGTVNIGTIIYNYYGDWWNYAGPGSGGGNWWQWHREHHHRPRNNGGDTSDVKMMLYNGASSFGKRELDGQKTCYNSGDAFFMTCLQF